MFIDFSGVSRTMSEVRLRTEGVIHLIPLPSSESGLRAGAAIRGQMGDPQCS